MEGKEVCYHHGGTAGAPIKHGLYSKSMPADLRKAYEEHCQDAELFDLRQDIAAITAMATAELEGAKDGAPSLELWQEAARLYQAVIDGGPAGVTNMKALGKVLKDGKASAERIARAAKLIEQRTKTVQVRQKLELESERNLTIAQAMAYTMALASGVKAEVEAAEMDPRVKELLLRGITLHIARSMRRSLGPGADAGDGLLAGN